jgi:hypothetical protein
MLALDDVLELPRGVSIRDEAVEDQLRDARYPVNSAALFVLSRAGRPLGEVATELARAYGLQAERARRDVLAFTLELNRRLLANVRTGAPPRRLLTLVVLAVRLAPVGRLPPPLVRRAPLDTTSPVRAVVSTALALRRRLLMLTVLGGLLTAQLTLLSGANAALLVLPPALAFGVLAHEAAHAATLGGAVAALVLAGPRAYVMHAPVGSVRRPLVAAAGPAVPTVLGVGLVVVATVFGTQLSALAGCALVGHAAGLTVLTGDGRIACGL